MIREIHFPHPLRLALSVFLWAILALCLATASAQQPPAQPQQTGQSNLILPGDPNEVSTQQMRVPPTFLYEGSGSDDTVDPFSSAEGKRQTLTTQQILSEALGIDFPEGTYAHYDPRTGALAVRHHPAVMKAISLYINAIADAQEKLVLVRVEIFQMPMHEAMRIQRHAEAKADNTQLWAQVSRACEDPNSSTEAVTSVSLHARSGQRAKAEDYSEFIYPTEVDWSTEKEAIIPAAFETRYVGTILEVDPVIGADDVTIDLNFSVEHHTAPPTMHSITVASPDKGTQFTAVQMPEFHCKRITTSITTYDGTTKLIGAWRPTGKPEYAEQKVMHLVFLRAAIQKVGEIVLEGEEQ
jgi:hypothetical protein